MKELICNRIDEIMNPVLETLYEIGINDKENSHKNFMRDLASTLEYEFSSIENCRISTTKISDYKILAFQFYIICGEEKFAKIIMCSKNINRTGVFDFFPKDTFDKALGEFIGSFKSENRQNKIKKILN